MQICIMDSPLSTYLHVFHQFFIHPKHVRKYSLLTHSIIPPGRLAFIRVHAVFFHFLCLPRFLGHSTSSYWLAHRLVCYVMPLHFVNVTTKRVHADIHARSQKRKLTTNNKKRTVGFSGMRKTDLPRVYRFIHQKWIELDRYIYYKSY